MVTIFLEYLRWHFTIAPKEILRIMGNYLKATRHQFLLSQHLKTLFDPWHRQNPSDFGTRERTFFDKILDSIADLYIRLIAACIRMLIILAGLLWQLVLLIVFLAAWIIWMVWPVLTIFLIIKGITIF